MAPERNQWTRRQLLVRGGQGASLLGLVPLLEAVGSSRALASSGRATTAAGKPKRGGTLTVGRHTEPTQLDPANSIVEGDVWTLDKIFEPLYMTTPGGQLVPWLARGHTLSADGKTWTFALRPGVKFSDGRPLAAQDVAFSIARNQKGQGPLNFLDSAIKSIRTSGPNTVVVDLRQHWAPFLSDITVFANAIVPKDFGGQSASTFFAHPVGTGPFMLTAFQKGSAVTLARNPHYWQSGKPYLDKVVLKLVQDDNQRVLQLKGGQLDIADAIPAASVQDLRSSTSVGVRSFPAWSVDLLFFNEKVRKFADRHVRRAIAYAIDTHAIATATTFGTATPGASFFPPRLQYFDPHTPVLSTNLKHAKAELARSSQPHGFTTKLLISSGNQVWGQAAQIIQAQLKPLGIIVQIEQLDDSAYHQAFQAFKYEMMINNAVNDISDPDEMASFQIDTKGGGSTSFWTNYDNPAAIALVHQAEAEYNDAKRATLYAKIQAIVATDAPYIPLTYPPFIYGVAKRVNGFEVNPGGAYRLEGVWLN